MGQEVNGNRITVDPRVMGGRLCLRGLRVTVATIAELLASEHSVAEVLELYPYLDAEDIRAVEEWAAAHRRESRRAAVRGRRTRG